MTESTLAIGPRCLFGTEMGATERGYDLLQLFDSPITHLQSRLAECCIDQYLIGFSKSEIVFIKCQRFIRLFVASNLHVDLFSCCRCSCVKYGLTVRATQRTCYEFGQSGNEYKSPIGMQWSNRYIFLKFTS